jgi:hypothetical protein
MVTGSVAGPDTALPSAGRRDGEVLLIGRVKRKGSQ